MSSSSISRWRQASEEFRDALERARAEFERDRVLALLEAVRPDGLTDWRAHAWLLRNASQEGGYSKAANPLPNAAPKNLENLPKNTLRAGGGDAEGEGASKKPENLPKNTLGTGGGAAESDGEVKNPEILPENSQAPAPGLQPSSPVPPKHDAPKVRGIAARATSTCAVNKPDSVPKIVPGERESAFPQTAGLAYEAAEVLSRVA